MSRKSFALTCFLFVAGMYMSACGGSAGNGGSGGGSQPVSVSVTASGTTVDANDAVTLTAAVSNDKNAAGVTWSVSGGGTLSNTTTSSATYTAPAPSSTALTVTVTATSVADATKTGTATITVPAKPAITTGALPAGTVGSAYSATMAGSVGIGPYTWSITSGTLPAGLTMNSAGVIAGTPTAAAAGTTNLTFVLTDSGKATALTATVTLGLTISAAPAIAFTGTVPSTATYNSAYTGSAAASGGAGALTYSLASGALPTGLSLNAAIGAVTGTPTAVGTFPFSVTATDAFGDSLTQPYSITVNPATPTLTFAAITTHTYGDAPFTVSATSASGGAVTYSVTSGPATIAGNSVTLTGAGTVVLGASQAATTNYTTATGSTSFTVNSETPALTFASIPSHTFGDAPFAVSATSASSGAVTYSVTSGPATLAGNTVTITGAGTVMLGASQASDGNYGAATASINFTVNPATPTLTFTAVPTHTYGDAPFAVSATSASSGAVTYSVTSGPATVAGNTVTLTGSGTVVLGASQSATADYAAATASTSFTVNSALSITTSTTLPPGTANTSYSQQLAASGGSGTYTNWTVTAGGPQLAAINLSLSTGGGLSGTPLAGGSANFTVQVTDSLSHTATASFTVTVYSALTVTTPSLPATNVGASYSQTLAAAGGTGSNFSWTASSSNLSTYGLSFSTTGVVSGTPTQAGTATFTANVTDSSSNTAQATLSITIYGALSLPAPNPSSLPSTGYTSVAYTGTINASGGSGNYSWQVTGLSDNLSPSPAGGTLTIAGTPGATPATVSFNVTLTDTTTNASVTQNGYSIAIGAATPVTLPTPSSTVPGSATQNQSYNGTITVSGGVSPYTWSINGTTVTAGGLSLGNNFTATSSGGSSLNIAGTPTTTTTVNLNNVMVTDKLGSTQTNSYTIAVTSTGSSVSGQIFLNGNCGSSGSQPPFTVTINTTPTATTTTTDGSGHYSFTGIPNGTYTITPSIPGASSSLFYPTSYAFLTLNSSTNNNVTGENFNAVVGYTVSGTVSYTTGGTAQTGQTYLVLNSNYCGSFGAPGTSITNATLTSGGAFTIRGVPPGAYTLTAWMDPIGQGLQNAIDPTGSSSVTVSTANVTDAAVTMTDPTFTTPSSNPTISGITPNPQGVLINFSPSKNSNNIEDANQYVVQWSTSPTLGGGSDGAQLLCAENNNVCPSQTFTANGDNGVWILTNSVAGAGSFASGQTYYFQARSFNSLDTSSPHPAGWTNYTAGGSSLAGVTIGTPACSGTCTSVSGSVTIPSSVIIQPGASLYLGLIQMDPNSGNPTGIYATAITNPVTGANSYMVNVPIGSNYGVFGILDQSNVGQIARGVITNVRKDLTANLTVSGGTMTGQDATLPTAGALVDVQTNYYQTTSSSGSSTGYQINFEVSESNKLPVSVTLSSGPNLPNNNGTVAIDMSNCTDCGNAQFNYYASLPGGAPAVNDTYDFTVNYSDGSQDTGSVINGKVSAFGSTGAVVGPGDLATNLSPSASSSTSLTPTFYWSFPANPGNYYYSGYIGPSNCSGSCSNIWQIPGSNSKSKGFTFAETGSGNTGTLTWGIDPILGDNSTPTGSLILNTVYNWQIQVQDSNGNTAQTTTWYQP